MSIKKDNREACWQDIESLDIFQDKTNPHYDLAWKNLEEFQKHRTNDIALMQLKELLYHVYHGGYHDGYNDHE